MKWIFWIALQLRLRQKFWGTWFIRWHTKQVHKAIKRIDTKNIKLTTPAREEEDGA